MKVMPLILGLVLLAPLSVLADDDEVTIRVMEQHEFSAEHMYQQIELPDAASDAAEDNGQQQLREQDRLREHTEEQSMEMQQERLMEREQERTEQQLEIQEMSNEAGEEHHNGQGPQ